MPISIAAMSSSSARRAATRRCPMSRWRSPRYPAKCSKNPASPTFATSTRWPRRCWSPRPVTKPMAPRVFVALVRSATTPASKARSRSSSTAFIARARVTHCPNSARSTGSKSSAARRARWAAATPRPASSTSTPPRPSSNSRATAPSPMAITTRSRSRAGSTHRSAIRSRRGSTASISSATVSTTMSSTMCGSTTATAIWCAASCCSNRPAISASASSAIIRRRTRPAAPRPSSSPNSRRWRAYRPGSIPSRAPMVGPP